MHLYAHFSNGFCSRIFHEFLHLIATIVSYASEVHFAVTLILFVGGKVQQMRWLNGLAG
jgi:hypothetical protein